MNAHRLSTLVVLLGVAASRPDTAVAQDTSGALSAYMLKRLGEAVDGYRTGRPSWVAMHVRPPHRVRGVFTSRDSAAAAARRAGPGYRVFGPYVAAADVPGDSVFYFGFVFCPDHSWETECPDTTFPGDAVAANLLDSVTVAVHAGSRTIRRRYLRGQVDAVFFTLSAMDKFLIPYYARLHGGEYATRLRARYLSELRAATRPR